MNLSATPTSNTENTPVSPIISHGNTAFESIHNSHSFYIDKIDFIRQWWEDILRYP